MALYQNYPYTDLQTVNLDGMVKQVKENKDNVESVTETADATAAGLAEETAARIRNVNNLQTQINNIIAGTAQVQDRAYNVNRKRRILFVTDNFATIEETSCYDQAANYLGISAAGRQILTRQGAGFHPASYALARTFANMLAGATLEIDADTITDVVFSGGAYDVGAATSDIAAGINDCCAWVKTNIPNAKVWILFATWRPDITNNNDFVNTYNTYRLYAAANGALFDYAGIGIHAFSYLDGTLYRPNTDGSRSLGFTVAQILAGTPTSAFNVRAQSVTFTPLSPLTATTSNLLTTRIAGTNIFINSMGRLTFDGTTDIGLTVWYDIGTVTETMFSSGNRNPQSIDIPCAINYTSGVHAQGSCSLRIIGNVLQCSLRAVNPNTGGWYGAAPVSTVWLLNGSATLDAVSN